MGISNDSCLSSPPGASLSYGVGTSAAGDAPAEEQRARAIEEFRSRMIELGYDQASVADHLEAFGQDPSFSTLAVPKRLGHGLSAAKPELFEALQALATRINGVGIARVILPPTFLGPVVPAQDGARVDLAPAAARGLAAWAPSLQKLDFFLPGHPALNVHLGGLAFPEQCQVRALPRAKGSVVKVHVDARAAQVEIVNGGPGSSRSDSKGSWPVAQIHRRLTSQQSSCLAELAGMPDSVHRSNAGRLTTWLRDGFDLATSLRPTNDDFSRWLAREADKMSKRQESHRAYAFAIAWLDPAHEDHIHIGVHLVDLFSIRDESSARGFQLEMRDPGGALLPLAGVGSLLDYLPASRRRGGGRLSDCMVWRIQDGSQPEPFKSSLENAIPAFEAACYWGAPEAVREAIAHALPRLRDKTNEVRHSDELGRVQESFWNAMQDGYQDAARAFLEGLPRDAKSRKLNDALIQCHYKSHFDHQIRLNSIEDALVYRPGVMGMFVQFVISGYLAGMFSANGMTRALMSHYKLDPDGHPMGEPLLHVSLEGEIDVDMSMPGGKEHRTACQSFHDYVAQIVGSELSSAQKATLCSQRFNGTTAARSMMDDKNPLCPAAMACAIQETSHSKEERDELMAQLGVGVEEILKALSAKDLHPDEVPVERNLAVHWAKRLQAAAARWLAPQPAAAAAVAAAPAGSGDAAASASASASRSPDEPRKVQEAASVGAHDGKFQRDGKRSAPPAQVVPKGVQLARDVDADDHPSSAELHRFVKNSVVGADDKSPSQAPSGNTTRTEHFIKAGAAGTLTLACVQKGKDFFFPNEKYPHLHFNHHGRGFVTWSKPGNKIYLMQDGVVSNERLVRIYEDLRNADASRFEFARDFLARMNPIPPKE